MANLIKVIHTGKKSLGWDDDTYRGVLARLTQKHSAKDCTQEELDRVLAYMREQGFSPKPARKHGRRPNVASTKKAMLGKIEALLAESGRAWTYAEGIANRMFKQTKLEWLTVEQMRALMNALQYDAKRHGRSS
ncbi:gp16 family protein [Enterobacter ludwigii]